MQIYIRPTVVTRLLAILLVFVFCFGVWSWRYAKNLRETEVREMETIKLTVHDRGYINSWLMFVDREKKTAQVLTVEDVKRDIFFEAQDEFFDFLENECSSCKILPVTFVCGDKINLECDLNKPYDLYVLNRKVRPVIVRKNPKNNP